jgi:hypothetical protein
MTDLTEALSALRRPKILIRAARAGVADYRRERDLKRILRGAQAGDRPGTIAALIAEEDKLEQHRASGEATYRVQLHVAVLTAIIAEARALTAASGRERGAAGAPPPAPVVRPMRRADRPRPVPFAAQSWQLAGGLAAGLG